MHQYSIRVVALLSGSLVATCLALVACSGPQSLDRAITVVDESAYTQALADQKNDPAEAFLTMRVEELGISAEQAVARDQALSTTKNPFKARKDPVAVSRGAVVYKKHCADCHGQNADGRGTRLPEALAGADFHDFSHRFASTLHHGAPRAWFRKITGGYTAETPNSDGTFSEMPAFNDTLAREQVWLVITYLQSLDADLQDDARAENE